MPRKRGAQPGNTNALKHGFYSRQFRELELADLEAVLTRGLESEIAMLRVVIRRVLELAGGIDDFEQARDALSALGSAAARLATLLRTQKTLLGDTDYVSQAISNGLQDVLKEFKIIE